MDAAPIAADIDVDVTFVADEFHPVNRGTAELWRNKRGNAIRPELLACVKFVGNEARQFFTDAHFSHFYAIDDEGVYYHLQLLELSRLQPPPDPVTLDIANQYEDLKNLRILDSPLMQDSDSEGADVVGNLVLEKNGGVARATPILEEASS